MRDRIKGIRKISLLLMGLLLMMGMSACTNKPVESGSECIIELIGVPKEMDMLSDNIRENFYVRVSLQNIYTEKRTSVELYEADDFKTSLKLQPGTYRVEYCSVARKQLLPMEVKETTDTVEVFQDKTAKLMVKVENPEEVSDWIWNQQGKREVIDAGAFSHTIQFCGEIIDLKDILNYIEIDAEQPVKAYEKQVLTGTNGVSITVLNETGEPAKWQDCTLKKVRFGTSNVIWGQGAYPGMSVKDVMHVQEGLYGKPTKMTGTVLVGTGYGDTMASWLDEKSGDKLTLEISSDGKMIDSIEYEFAVFE